MIRATAFFTKRMVLTKPSTGVSVMMLRPTRAPYYRHVTAGRWMSESTTTTTTETEEQAKPDPEPTQEEQAADAASPPEEESELSMEKEIKELKNQLLRSLAEQDNTRRIAHRDVSQAQQYAIKSFAKSLLDVSDNLERALGAVPPIPEDESGSVLANLVQGIQLTEKGLNKAFEANGVVKFGTPGEVFDPNKHEALMEYADPNATPGTVGQIMKPGFMLRERVLRPAEVGVIKKA